jgi:hypothetical protein
VVKYYLPSELETVDDARELFDPSDGFYEHGKKSAERIAEYWYAYEEACFPLTVALVDDDGSETQWEVEAHVSTSFCAKEVRG